MPDQPDTEGSSPGRRRKRSYTEALRLQLWRALGRLELNQWLTLIVALGALGAAVVSCSISVDQKQMAGAIAQLSNIAVGQQDEVNALGNQTAELTNEVNATWAQASAATNQAEGTAALIGPAQTTASAAVAGNHLQEQHFRNDERPIISLGSDSDLPRGINFGLGYDPATKIVFWNYPIRNYGKGLAISIRFQEYMSFFGGQFKVGLSGAGTGRTGSDIAPTGTSWSSVSYPDAFDQGTVNRISLPDYRAIAIVVVTYKDTEGNSYENDICMEENRNLTMGNCDARRVVSALHSEGIVPLGAPQ